MINYANCILFGSVAAIVKRRPVTLEFTQLYMRVLVMSVNESMMTYFSYITSSSSVSALLVSLLDTLDLLFLTKGVALLFPLPAMFGTLNS